MAARKSVNIQSTIEHWKHISKNIHEPQNASDYHHLSMILDKLLDVAADDENHELMGLIDVISYMIAAYDDRAVDHINPVSGIEALKFLMQQNNLKQSDMTDIGTQGVVSEILQGKRALNIKQIKRLSIRFHVTPNIFID